MNTESLRIELDHGAWNVTYHGWAETPIHPQWPESGPGQNEIDIVTRLGSDIAALHQAEKYAREWAVSSGFKAGPLKIKYGNTLEIRLRRP